MITIHSLKCLLKQFCNDTCITIEADHDSLLEFDRLFDKNSCTSGLKINYDDRNLKIRFIEKYRF